MSTGCASVGIASMPTPFQWGSINIIVWAATSHEGIHFLKVSDKALKSRFSSSFMCVKIGEMHIMKCAVFINNATTCVDLVKKL